MLVTIGMEFYTIMEIIAMFNENDYKVVHKTWFRTINNVLKKERPC